MVCHITARACAEGVREQGAEGDVWASEGGVTGEWRKLRGEELQGLYCLPNVMMSGACSTYGGE